MQNHFDLFNLPQRFSIDLEVLNRAYREVQGQVHPDRFANASDAEKRVAMQWATRANEAFQVLKSPLQRAIYLCELNGIELGTESNTAMPREFLMQQMEWREELDDAKAAKDLGELETLEMELKNARSALERAIGEQLDGGKFEQAAQQVRQLMFIQKFGDDIARAFDSVTG
jgi:molecular chaperone HscB